MQKCHLSSSRDNRDRLLLSSDGASAFVVGGTRSSTNLQHNRHIYLAAGTLAVVSGSDVHNRSGETSLRRGTELIGL